MPMYEFRCLDCDVDFEDLVPSGTEAWPCPKCGQRNVRRLASAAAFSVGGKMTTTAKSDCVGCATGQCGSCGCGHHH